MKRRLDPPCSKDCPRRSVSPNCHNPELCPEWAAYLKKQAALKAARQNFKAAEDDFSAVKVEKARKAAKEAKRR